MNAKAGWVPTALLGAVALWLSFANYGIAHDLIGGDANAAWALPSEELRDLAGVFANYPGLGLNASEGIQGVFPALAGAAALHALGIGAGIAARLMLALYFFVALTGAERLGSALLVREAPWVRRLGALSGALLFGVNSYTIHVFGTVETYFPLGYVVLPWVLYGILAGCESDRRFGIATIAIALVVAGGVAVNPAFFAMTLLAIPLGAALVLAEGIPLGRVLLVCSGGIAFGLGLCAWWVLPAPTAFAAGLGQVVSENASAWVQWMSARSGFEQLMRLDGYVGGDAIPFAAWYSSPLGSLLGYGPLACALAGAGIVRRRFGAVALLAFALFVFLAKGVHAPAGGLYGALIDHLPGFSVFRSPYDKWEQLAALMLVVLYDLGFAGIVRRVGSARYARPAVAVAVASVATACVLIYPWPAFAGRILEPSPDPLVSFQVTLPSDYRRVADFLRANSGGHRTIVLNAGGSPYPLFTWGYFGEDPLPIAAGVPVAGPDVVPRAPVLSAQQFERALDALAVRFVVVHDDLRNALATGPLDDLLAAGDVRLVLTTPALRVYQRRREGPQIVSLIHDGALIEGAGDHPSELAVDPLQTAQLVPNAGAEFGAPGATPLASAKREPQAGDATLGRLTDANGIPAAPPGAAAFGALPGSAATVVVPRLARCGSVGPALRLSPAIEWRIGAVRLWSLDRTFCLDAPPVGGASIDGTIVAIGSGQVPLSGRREHTLKVRVVHQRAAALALPVAGAPVAFHFVSPVAADTIEVFAPAGLARSSLSVTVSAPDGTVLGSGYDGLQTSSFLVPLVTRPVARGERCILDFRTSSGDLLPGLARQRLVRLFAERTYLREFAFQVGAAAASARTLGAIDVKAGARRNPPAGPAIRPQWESDPAASARTGATSAAILDVREPGRPVAFSAPGVLEVAARYRLVGTYRAAGDVSLDVNVNGYSAARPISLVADGRLRRIDEMVYPPSLSSGNFVLDAGVGSRGSLLLRDVALDVAGPNALEYALSPRRASGTLVAGRRLAPWWFEATVRDCAPCELRVAVSEPLHWLVRGARVLGTYEGAGQSTGMSWSSKVTGAAVWVVDAGAGTHTLQIAFWPVFLAGAGLLLALATVVAGAIFLARLGRGERFTPVEPATAISFPARMLRNVALALALVVAPTTSLGVFADAAGAALWLNLVVLGVLLL